MTKLLLGTSGYSYSDWIGPFYPEGHDKSEQLSFYSTFFNTVEINFTYYKIPNPHIFDRMAAKVPDDFIFSVKMHSSMTHTRDCSPDDYKCYIDALKPLQESGKLGAILMQFPWGFKLSASNMEYLESLRDKLGDLELCVEFRHSSWLTDEVYSFLRSNDLGFCNVDQPRLKTLLPPTDINTTDSAYIRFHGRNAANWWKPAEAYMRYDHMYSQDELIPWIPRIKKLSTSTKKSYIYFNNHYKAQAVKSANLLQNLLKA
jgi:uncharacterized protein YecE (DUF72 family)